MRDRATAFGAGVVAGMLVLSGTGVRADHRHHEVEVLHGAVVDVRAGVIDVEVFNSAAFRLEKISVTIDDETEFVDGAGSAERPELADGERIETTVHITHDDDGADQFRAVKIRRP